MNRGYTKRWRKRWDKGYHKDHLLWILMDYFIDHANHRDTKVYFPGCGLAPVKRGQHIFGTVQLAVFLGIDRSRLRRKLKILAEVGFATIKATNKYSILTVINYDTYQPRQGEIDQQTAGQSTSNRPATDQQPTTPKNVKNVKNENNNPPYSPPTGDDDKAVSYSHEFKSFWIKYPKKVAKDAAWKAWKKIKRPNQTLTDISEALDWQIESEEWTKDNGQYIPNPSTYLNQGRWKDEKTEGGSNDVFDKFRRSASEAR